MIKLNIRGVVLDLEGSVSIALKFEGIKDVTKMATSRTQSFTIPLTTRNKWALGMAQMPELHGGAVRISQSAILSYDGGAVDGSLVITAMTETEVTATFTFGELTDLVAIKNAGKLGEIVPNPAETPTTGITLRRGGYYYEDSRYINEPIYFNGHGTTAGLRLPSMKVSTYMEEAATALSATIGKTLTYGPAMRSAIGGKRIVLNTLNSIGEGLVSGSVTAFDGGAYQHTTHYTIDGVLTSYFQNPSLFFVQADGVPERSEDGFWYNIRAGEYQPIKRVIGALKCIQAVHLHISGTNTEGGSGIQALKRPCGWFVLKSYDSVDIQSGETLQSAVDAKAVMRSVSFDYDLEVGDLLVYGKFDDFTYMTTRIPQSWTEIGSAKQFYCPTDYSGTYSFELTSASDTIQATKSGTENIYTNYTLKANMPEVKYIDLCKALAMSVGGVLTYDPDTAVLDVFDYDFDGKGGDVFSVDENLISLTNISRSVSDFGGGTIRSLKILTDDGWVFNAKDKQNASKSYLIPNEVAGDATEDTAELATAPSIFSNGFDYCNIPCAGYDDDSAETIETISSPVLVEGHSYSTAAPGYITPVIVPYNQNFVQICALSTEVQVSVKMPMWRFMRMKRTDRFTYRGGWYYCTAATWSKNIAKLTIQRYK